MSTLIEKLEEDLEYNLAIKESRIAPLEHSHYYGYCDAMSNAIDIVKQHSDWVSVDERLPELGERVLTFTASGIETLYRSQYDNDLFIWERDCCQDYWTDEQVTHWQPLPQPPSEVQP